MIGVSEDHLFQMMDSIANTIDDLCEPQIIPDIEPLTINGKTVIVISVEVGKNRPYYLKSKGKDNGTYIRMVGRQDWPIRINLKNWKWKDCVFLGMNLLA